MSLITLSDVHCLADDSSLTTLTGGSTSIAGGHADGPFILLIDVGILVWVLPCHRAPFATLPYCRWQKALANSAEFICETETGDPVSWLNLFAKLVPTGFLWGLGTALGEIPPYFVSYCAAKLGNQVSTPSQAQQSNNSGSKETLTRRVLFCIMFSSSGGCVEARWIQVRFEYKGIRYCACVDQEM